MARYRLVSLTQKARSASVTLGTFTEPDDEDDPLEEEPVDGDVVDFPQPAAMITVTRPAANREPVDIFSVSFLVLSNWLGTSVATGAF
jgi:hypothetical protein